MLFLQIFYELFEVIDCITDQIIEIDLFTWVRVFDESVCSDNVVEREQIEELGIVIDVDVFYNFNPFIK